MPPERADDREVAPFRPDRLRGFWDRPSDYIFSSVCNVFRLDAWLFIVIVFEIFKSGIFGLLVLLVNVVLYAFPIVFIQTFLGQFTGNGFMAVYRMTPIFKGMAYIALFLNLMLALCCGAITAMSLLIFIRSLQPVLPWSCEGLPQWMDTRSGQLDLCHLNYTASSMLHLDNPTSAFLKYEIEKKFPLFACSLLIWVGVAFILDDTKERIQKIGRILRCGGIAIIALLTIVLIRLMSDPRVRHGLVHISLEDHSSMNHATQIVFMVPLLISVCFGPGFGLIISMAGYCRFKINTIRFSWLTCLGQVQIVGLLSLICISSEILLRSRSCDEDTECFADPTVTQLNIESMFPLSAVSSLTKLRYAHLWSWALLLSFFLGSFNLLITQTLSIEGAWLDEFQNLRPYKRRLNLVIVALLALVTTSLCNPNGFEFLCKLSEYSLFTCSSMHLLLILIVGWIYGKNRLQRDVEFMINHTLATWKINLMRFVTPFLLLLSLYTTVVVMFYGRTTFSLSTLLVMGIVFLPWLALPGLGLSGLLQSKGSIGLRLKQCVSPSYWYPADAEEKKRYEQKFTSLEKPSRPLTALNSDL